MLTSGNRHSPVTVPGTIAALGLVAAAWALPTALAYAPAPLERAIGARRRLRDTSRIALTFDDGPQPVATEAVLDVLARERVRATFFIVGAQVARSPGLVHEIDAAGHEVGCHGEVHVNHLRRSPLGLTDDLRRSRGRLEDLLGRSIDLYRPPQGALTWPSLRAVRSSGLELVLWSRWVRDWERSSTPARIGRLGTRDLQGGEIVLLHDADTYARRSGTWRDTVAALPAIIDGARMGGLEPTSIGGRHSLS